MGFSADKPRGELPGAWAQLSFRSCIVAARLIRPQSMTMYYLNNSSGVGAPLVVTSAHRSKFQNAFDVDLYSSFDRDLL